MFIFSTYQELVLIFYPEHQYKAILKFFMQFSNNFYSPASTMLIYVLIILKTKLKIMKKLPNSVKSLLVKNTPYTLYTIIVY